MANLEAKVKMSPWQLGIVATSGLLTARLLPATSHFISYAEQFAWLSSTLAGLFFYLAAYLMIRLGEQFPNETIGEYIPRLLGNKAGAAVFLVFITVLLVNIINCAIAITTLSTIFLFDRTPQAVLIIVLLIAVVYCAMQEWGTILRVIQMLVLALPLLYIFYSLVWLNFEPLNLLPLWPDNFIGILQGIPYHTDYYAGYESLLVLLPLASRGKVSFARTVGWGFLVITAIYVVGAVVLVGSITAKTIANVPQAVIYGMKSIELPGTFIERLENYMIMFFMPVTYISMVLSYFAVAEGCRKYLKYNDHRTFIPVFLPLLFFVSSFMDTPYRREMFRDFSMFLALFFSFVIIPILLYLVGRKKGSNQQC
ncbi:MAG: spore germination protein [Firmicutes bacterium]|nr:spore germination protein [Bacillota bacterium]